MFDPATDALKNCLKLAKWIPEQCVRLKDKDKDTRKTV